MTATWKPFLEENEANLVQCEAHGLPFHLIDQVYDVESLDLGLDTSPQI